ncbi:hypothetical protein N431DRAFT_432787 [Stipitochalara longipes BDJ]|nr:hypothetical protein N431DRAFT_432787 [Stipitochalara longipes BDJ]
MNNAYPPPWSGNDPARVAQRGAPLSITTSRPQFDGSRPDQYPADQSFAQPRSSPPYRTVSSPYPPPSPAQRGTATRASSGEVPKSAGYTDGSLRFLKGSNGDKSPSSSRNDKLAKAKRRHSHESKVNNYTECGRHGDDWLFGGFSVSDSVKKLWERDKKS